MRLEAPQDLEGRREYPHNSIITSQEQTIGSRAHTADFVVVKKGLALVVGWFNLSDFEEIERFPLQYVSIDYPHEALYSPKSTPFHLTQDFMLLKTGIVLREAFLGCLSSGL